MKTHFKRSGSRRGFAPWFRLVRLLPRLACVLGAVVVGAPATSQAAPAGTVPDARSAVPPEGVGPACDNDALTGYDGLLVLAPHPDDETLAFAGLITAYMRQGKPVRAVVVTDGDAYCDACRFWKNGSLQGPTCSALELSNFATPEIDSFAEVRRTESAAAAAALGRVPPEFLGYPDTGLGAAWLNSRTGRTEKRLRRSDFSQCPDCETCQGGYGGGPETDLTSATLIASLSRLLSATTPNTLVATTHWLDGHADHAALGNFVKTINDALETPRPVVYAVIHGHTPKATAAPDCWYPGPEALVCPCFDEARARRDTTWITDLRHHRQRPDLPASLPDDAPYGAFRHLCLPEEIYRGTSATKLLAVSAYRSQLGSRARSGELPASLDALMDCNGYLVSFVRRTEAFVLTEPASPPSAACDPGGAWEGYGGANREGPAVETARFIVERTNGRSLVGALSLAGDGGAERQEVLVGEVDGRCTITLRQPQHPEILYRCTISKDGRSLYGSWGGPTPGFFVVHR
jgi:LmbE family N-acetylglucosaminyl deacetylase